MANLPKLLCRVVSWFAEPPQATPVQPTFLEMEKQKRSNCEKRASARSSVRIGADLVDQLEGLPFSVAVENLSKHGLYFIGDTSFAIGSAVEVTLEFPPEVDGESRMVHLLVRIVRVDARNDGRFGIAAQIMRCRTLERAAAGEASQQAPTLTPSESDTTW